MFDTLVHEQMLDVCVNDMDRCETRKKKKTRMRDFSGVFLMISEKEDVIFRRKGEYRQRKKM